MLFILFFLHHIFCMYVGMEIEIKGLIFKHTKNRANVSRITKVSPINCNYLLPFAFFGLVLPFAPFSGVIGVLITFAASSLLKDTAFVAYLW